MFFDVLLASVLSLKPRADFGHSLVHRNSSKSCLIICNVYPASTLTIGVTHCGKVEKVTS